MVEGGVKKSHYSLLPRIIENINDLMSRSLLLHYIIKNFSWAKAKQLSKQGLLASAQPQDGQQNKTGQDGQQNGHYQDSQDGQQNKTGWSQDGELNRGHQDSQDGQQNNTRFSQDYQQNKDTGQSREKGKEDKQDQAQNSSTIPGQTSESTKKGKESLLNGSEGRSSAPPAVAPRSRLQRGTTIPTPPAPSRMSSVSSRTPSLSSGATSLSLGTPSFTTPASSQPKIPPPIPARRNFSSTAL